MKTCLSVTMGLCFFIFGFSGCDKNNPSDHTCNEITQGQPFTARLGEQWCLDQENLKITFGPFIEDSRCNVIGIECVWAGRYVMAATIIHDDATDQDTFYAVHNWTDTLHTGNLSIFLNKVFPESRPTTDPIDQKNYSFEVVVK